MCIIFVIAIIFWQQRQSPEDFFKSFEKPDNLQLREKQRQYRRPQIRIPVVRAEHKYRSDGILEVNPNGKHPIYELIDSAEARWKRKLARQSKTLKQAVNEYKRRYRRPPPKGFDAWYISCSHCTVFS
jgi:hypothetical protein